MRKFLLIEQSDGTWDIQDKEYIDSGYSMKIERGKFNIYFSNEGHAPQLELSCDNIQIALGALLECK